MVGVRGGATWLWCCAVVMVMVAMQLLIPLPNTIPTFVFTLPTFTSNQCQAMFTIERGTHTSNYSDAWYSELSKQVASLVGVAGNNKGVYVYPGTRLNLMAGSVPYIPCKVAQYNEETVGRCTKARAKSETSTWIAFYGDSTMRQKLDVLINILPPELTYAYYLNNTQVNRTEFLYRVAYHLENRPALYDIIGYRDAGHGLFVDDKGSRKYEKIIDTQDDTHVTPNAIIHPGGPREGEILGSRQQKAVIPRTHELRVTLVWATSGSRSGSSKETGQPVTQLHEWAGEEIVPQIIVLGFGKWFMKMRQTSFSELESFTELDALTRPLVESITKLAQRTQVLLWAQSRYRWHNFQFAASKVNQNKKEWKKTLYLTLFTDSIPFIDAWLRNLLGPTGVWWWDSTLPFNLANIHECDLMRNTGNYQHEYYTGNWWFCSDPHHSSYETNTNEVQMLLNLLCNPYLATKDHCCASYGPPLIQ